MSGGPEARVAAVVVDADRLLMVRRGHGPGAGLWSVPGGRIERGETAAEAIVRELHEETGLAGVCGPLLGWHELIASPDHFVILHFEVTVLTNDDPHAGSDATEAQWVPLWEVPELRLVDGLAENLSEWEVIDLLA